jgi:hypothetical protein
MSCSTYTVRSCSGGGKPSTLPLAMARMRVDLPAPLACRGRGGQRREAWVLATSGRANSQ